MPSKKRESKKSESLDIRVSFETKEALQNKAASEGRSVSKIVRELIANYLSEQRDSIQPTSFKERAIMFKSTLFSKPKSIFAATTASAAIATALFMTTLSAPSAIAEEVNLDFETEFINQSHQGGTRTQTANTSFVIDTKQQIHICVDFDEKQFLLITEMAESEFPNGKRGLTFQFKLVEPLVKCDPAQILTPEPSTLANKDLTQDSYEKDKLIAMPKLSAVYGEQAMVEINMGDGFSYKWKVRPTLGNE